MILSCPVCQHPGFEPIHAVEKAPIFQLLPQSQLPIPEDFGQLDLVRCAACCHLYNRAYDSKLGGRMYCGDLLTNVPVDATMSQGLMEVADWIGEANYANRRVMEIGAGSGYLARVLAQKASSILVFEPSTGLRPEALPENNLTLINGIFDAALVPDPVDLIVFRHVLEYVADPVQMLRDIRSRLSTDGRFYVEVPRAEFVEQHASLFDLCYNSVQYFHEQNLLALVARAGFRPERIWHLKNGHDVGVMLLPEEGISAGEQWAPPSVPHDLRERLSRRVAATRAQVSNIEGKLALYGANWHGVGFLSAVTLEKEFAVAFDDNPSYRNYSLYTHNQCLPVETPSKPLLDGVETIFITAYLHEKVITDKLRGLGFCGDVINVQPDFENAGDG